MFRPCPSIGNECSETWCSDAVFGNGLSIGIGGERHIVFVGIVNFDDTIR